MEDFQDDAIMEVEVGWQSEQMLLALGAEEMERGLFKSLKTQKKVVRPGEFELPTFWFVGKG